MSSEENRILTITQVDTANMEIAESLASIKDSLPAGENNVSVFRLEVKQQPKEQNYTGTGESAENLELDYVTADSFPGLSYNGNTIEIPMDSTNIHVDESGVVYFNVISQEPAESCQSTKETEFADFSAAIGNDCAETIEKDIIIQSTAETVISQVTDENEMKNEDDPSEIHVCPLCKAFFATAAYLKDHMKRKCVRAKNINNAFACEYCPLSFKQRFQLNRHMMQHTGERPFKCEKCPKTFLTKSHLKRHAVVHLPKDQMRHKCEQCDKVFAWASTLESHMKSHRGEKRFKCGICGRMFLHLNSLRSHMVNRHTVNGKFTCVVCKECFDEPTDLILHMKTHNEQESVKCERCYAFFTSLSDLETHVCTNFGGKPLICVKCSVEFSDTNLYCSHTCMQINTNRRCGCCLKELKSLWHLREHLITHTGEKPFKCEQCLTSFRRKRELDIHLTRHGNERPFACKHCSQTFTSDNYLKQHIRKVHREKKFICDICNHAFMHKCALDNHMSFHLRTGNKNYGKKYHRDDGMLVEELVKERLALEKITNAEGDSETIFDGNPSENKSEGYVICNEGNLVVDDTIGLQEETLRSNMNNDGSQSVLVLNGEGKRVSTATADDYFSSKVIQPKIELRNAEQDPSNITTIYQTDCAGVLTIRCASCYQHCASHGELLRHRKEYHNDGKPYQCDFCSRTFSVAANLSQHRSIHNIKRKYSCKECGKSYKVTHKLREHLKVKHGVLTDDLTDLDLQLKYGMSQPNINSNPNFKEELLSSSEYLLDDISTERLSVGTPVISKTGKASSSDCSPKKGAIAKPSVALSSNSAKVLSNIVFVQSNGDTSTSITADDLCKRNDVSFLMNITTLINEIGSDSK